MRTPSPFAFAPSTPQMRPDTTSLSTDSLQRPQVNPQGQDQGSSNWPYGAIHPRSQALQPASTLSGSIGYTTPSYVGLRASDTTSLDTLGDWELQTAIEDHRRQLLSLQRLQHQRNTQRTMEQQGSLTSTPTLTLPGPLLAETHLMDTVLTASFSTSHQQHLWSRSSHLPTETAADTVPEKDFHFWLQRHNETEEQMGQSQTQQQIQHTRVALETSSSTSQEEALGSTLELPTSASGNHVLFLDRLPASPSNGPILEAQSHQLHSYREEVDMLYKAHLRQQQGPSQHRYQQQRNRPQEGQQVGTTLLIQVIC
ncbi:hypothetical protein BC939DRAFT_218831 [Gamsiella multidivaricata]|uniref:uncharacterized protein n=1 Tax=Gamsiella multidivaricata TaxID=101098 RepID=UPI00221FD593|nr:uncharacterized protein BC939DRAFT_218831 [Gamsiella multidivaricata]KAI7820861.1 hypothetical protein BC939DRAFT_218831 [Gamsiella multidivaricata]